MVTLYSWYLFDIRYYYNSLINDADTHMLILLVVNWGKLNNTVKIGARHSLTGSDLI